MMRHATTLAAVALVAVWVNPGATRAQELLARSLHALTVPESRLPEGCRLTPLVKAGTLRIIDAATGKASIATNDSTSSGPPIVTTNRAAVGTIRSHIRSLK
jgi:hypothetical protein